MLTVGREIVSASGWEIVLGTEPGTESINLLLSGIGTPIQILAENQINILLNDIVPQVTIW
jgi:hypothetical protein